MSVKLWKNETDTYVARDAVHAAELFNAHNGFDGPYDAEQFGEWSEFVKGPDEEMSIRMDDGRGSVKQTVSQWIAEVLAENPDGGMLCSTEW